MPSTCHFGTIDLPGGGCKHSTPGDAWVSKALDRCGAMDPNLTDGGGCVSASRGSMGKVHYCHRIPMVSPFVEDGMVTSVWRILPSGQGARRAGHGSVVRASERPTERNSAAPKPGPPQTSQSGLLDATWDR